MLFLDASALARAYIDEAGDGNVRGLLRRAGGELVLSEVVALEVLTAIRNAYRGLPRADYVAAVQKFWADYRSCFSVVEVTNREAVADAISLTTRYRAARARSMECSTLPPRCACSPHVGRERSRWSPPTAT